MQTFLFMFNIKYIILNISVFQSQGILVSGYVKWSGSRQSDNAYDPWGKESIISRTLI